MVNYLYNSTLPGAFTLAPGFLNSTGKQYKTGSSFSGSDGTAYIMFPNMTPVQLGEIATISYSSHRETRPARGFGNPNVRGFARGPRTIAGTMIFTLIDQSVMASYCEHYYEKRKKVGNFNSIETSVFEDEDSFFPDDLPPFTLLVNFANEAAEFGLLVLKHVVLTDNGQVISIEDIKTEETLQYTARSAKPIKRVKSPVISEEELDNNLITEK